MDIDTLPDADVFEPSLGEELDAWVDGFISDGCVGIPNYESQELQNRWLAGRRTAIECNSNIYDYS